MRVGSSKVKKKLNIKSGDTVFVTTGKEKGKTGKILRVIAKDNKAIVEKLNIVKKHTKPTQKSPTGGIVEKEAPIHISNLMLVDPSTNEPTRVGFRFLENGNKVRISKKSGEEI